MGWFDLPATNYGTHVPPIQIHTVVNLEQLEEVKKRADELKINYQRWFVTAGVLDFHENIYEGMICYFPEYNCIRDARHYEAETIDFKEFITKLKRYEVNSD